MPRSLFRKEAIDAQREKFLGEASVAQPVRMWVFTATACVIAALAVALAVWGQYTRRERVQGYLSSAVGAADVRMPDAGTITEVMVKEGDAVVAGTPMARLKVDRSGVDDASGVEAVLGELQRQVALSTEQREQTQRLGQQEIDQLKNRIVNLQTELKQADVEIQLQTERLGQSKQLLDKWNDLKAKDFASEFYVLQYQKEVKDQEIRVQVLQRQRATQVKDLQTAQSDLPQLRLRNEAQIQQIDQKISTTNQQIADERGKHDRDVKRDMIVTAPIDGTVTNIGPSRGQTVAADLKFATVLPKNSPLHAELLVPTRAIGFIKPGQSVTMRYEAFPYERFGQYGGKVDNVGKDVWTQGVTLGPLAVHEPVYRIVVDLDRQDITVNDQSFPLRAGMVVSADLLMERRTLLEWLFQPVLQLRKRIGSVDHTAAAPSGAS